MIRSVPEKLEELIMERLRDGAPSASDTGRAVDPSTLSFIERISWFERQKPVEADNDNRSHTTRDEQDSACFDSWALPDFMRN
jgi:hypothetical protein